MCLAANSVAGLYLFFFFNDTATTEIYTLSLHDALPIYWPGNIGTRRDWRYSDRQEIFDLHRSEEHTSELQSRRDLVCRLLLEKKKQCIESERSVPHGAGGVSVETVAVLIRMHFSSRRFT